MNVKIVSCVGPDGWLAYGKRFYDSVRKYWPEAKVEMWAHGGEDISPVPSKNLDNVEEFQHVQKVLGGANTGEGLKYVFKPIALLESAREDLDWLIWLDADTELLHPIDATFIEHVLKPEVDLVWLARPHVGKNEGSFLAFNWKRQGAQNLLVDFWGTHLSGEASHYKDMNDNFVLDRLVNLHKAHGLVTHSLSEGMLGLDMWHQSILGAYGVHYKGPNKDDIPNGGQGQPSRYHSLERVVSFYASGKPAFGIIEVGTHGGARAVQMAQAAFAAGVQEVYYSGYDVFEGELDREREFDGKPVVPEWIVARRLLNFQTICARQGKVFSFRLHKGNSTETLQRAKDSYGVTLAFIDGGHSFETVESDWSILKDVADVVVFDDVMEEEANAPDGPRRVFDSIDRKKTLINSADAAAGCEGKIRLGLVVRERDIPLPTFMTPIEVQPVNSVDESWIFDNIRVNTPKISEWMQMVQAHTKRAILVSAGPTLRKHLDELKKDAEDPNNIIFTVKHAIPTLVEEGIRIDYVVVLDPRDVNGVSTHGRKRKDLYANLPERTKVLFATMCGQGVLDYLLSQNMRVIGWHAYMNCLKENPLEETKVGLMVGGGTNSANRALMLAFILGFRRFKCYAYDFFYPDGTEQAGIEQKLMRVKVGKRDDFLLTTGELIAAMQDWQAFVPWVVNNRLTLELVGDGAAKRIWEELQPGYVNPLEELPT